MNDRLQNHIARCCHGNKRPAYRPARRGLSLLEVILAIAILGGALVIIGELMRIGSRSAQVAREMTTAQLLCESTLAEIAAGITEPQPVSRQPHESDPDWLYSIEAERIDQGGLLSVRVTVEQNLPSHKRPISFTLTRWILDPGIELEESTSDTKSSQSSSVSQSSSGAGSAKSKAK